MLQNHFSTVIKQLRLDRGMSMREFADEAGISLGSLVGYESGSRIPRGDTILMIAERLHIPAAMLMSDAPFTDQTVSSCMDHLSLQTQTLHPYVRTSAQYALNLLKSAFGNSEGLFRMEPRAAGPDGPAACFRYCLHESRSPLPSSFSYGILVEKRRNDVWTAAAVLAPFSNDRLAVLGAASAANELQLPPEQFFSDVFPDFFPAQR